MAITKNAVVKNTAKIKEQEEQRIREEYEFYEEKFDNRLLKGERKMIYQLDSRIELEAMRQLMSDYRKGNWEVKIYRNGMINNLAIPKNIEKNKVKELNVTGSWVFEFN